MKNLFRSPFTTLGIVALFNAPALYAASELKFQGLDASWFNIGPCSESECQVKGEVDHKHLHFVWKGTISNGPATSSIPKQLDDLEFAVGYFDNEVEAKGGKHQFNVWTMKALLKNEALSVKGEFALSSSWAKDASAKENFDQTNDYAADYKATLSSEEQTETQATAVDNAVALKWNKNTEKAPVAVTAPVQKPVTSNKAAPQTSPPKSPEKTSPIPVSVPAPTVATAPVKKVVPPAPTPTVSAPVVNESVTADETPAPTPKVVAKPKYDYFDKRMPPASKASFVTRIVPADYTPLKEQKIPSPPKTVVLQKAAPARVENQDNSNIPKPPQYDE